MARTLVCLKYFLMCCVVILGFSEAIICTAAAYFIYQLYEYGHLTPVSVTGPPIAILIMSIAICLVSWYGWQIMDYSNRVQIMIFVVLMVLTTFIHAAAGIWAIVRHDNVDALPQDILQKLLNELTTNETAGVWNHTQLKLRCCGVHGYKDYPSIPPSCIYDMGQLATEGCSTAVLARTRSTLLHIFLLALCAVILEMCLISVSIWYLRIMKEKIIKRKKLAVLEARSYTSSKLEHETNDRFLKEASESAKQVSQI